MRIAVTYENGNVFQHFGRTEQFKLYDVTDGSITGTQVVNTNGSGHGALAIFLAAHKADTLICGGIGAGAQNALSAIGIRIFGGVTGNADEAVNALLSGSLQYVPDISIHCGHHDHGESHCGGDSCCGHNG